MTTDSRHCPECEVFFPHGHLRSPATRHRHDMAVLAGLTIAGITVFVCIACAVMLLAILGGWSPGW